MATPKPIMERINEFLHPPSGFKGFAHGIGKGYGMGFTGGTLPFLAFGAYEAVKAPRGHKISAMAGGGIGFGVASIIGGAIGGAFGIPPQVTSLVAGFVLGGSIDRSIIAGAQYAVDFGSNMRKARYGGGYIDSSMALTMRQAAAREMSGSLLNARQWLGSEAAFLHQ